MIKKLLTLLRVLFLIAVFFVLGVFLVVLVMQNWSTDSQALAAVVFAIGMTWWIERKIKKRSLSEFKKPRDRHQNAQKAKKPQVNKSEKSAKHMRLFLDRIGWIHVSIIRAQSDLCSTPIQHLIAGGRMYQPFEGCQMTVRTFNRNLTAYWFHALRTELWTQ